MNLGESRSLRIALEIVIVTAVEFNEQLWRKWAGFDVRTSYMV